MSSSIDDNKCPMSSSSSSPVKKAPSVVSELELGKCPVRHEVGGQDENYNASTILSSSWWTKRFFSSSSSSSSSSSLLSSSSSSQRNLSSIIIPPSIEEAKNYSQSPQPDQSIPLSTTRMISSIPRADELRPVENSNTKPMPAHHQPSTSSNWVYPSEQQFYNAMRRKGYNIEDMVGPTSTGSQSQSQSPPAESPLQVIPYIVRIHNAVNERTWMEICRWERELHRQDQPRLIRFMGRPKDLSPKAWLNSRILFKKEPFDRHDWYIDRGDGKGERRYVIDFYSGQDGEKQETPQQDFPLSRPPSMYIDVRPALDTPDAFLDRMQMLVRDAFPGIARWTLNNYESHSSNHQHHRSQGGSLPSSTSTCPKSQ